MSLFLWAKTGKCHRHFHCLAAWTKKEKIENGFAGHVISYIQQQNDTWCHSEKLYCKKREELSTYENEIFFFCKADCLPKMSQAVQSGYF